MLGRVALMVAALFVHGEAAAQASPEFPGWDPQAHCERQNRILATESAFMLRACLQQEDSAEAILRRSWEALTPPIKRTCLAQQRTLRMTSYFMLNACVEMERGAERDIQQRPARR